MKAINSLKTLLTPLTSPASWRTLAHYIGLGKGKNKSVIKDAEALAQFISSRARHVTQTSLYGYLRTRAGTRFPELFKNTDILISINIAKWHIWMACVSDLCVFIGQIMYQSGQISPTEIESLMSTMLDRILNETEVPAEAGEDFEAAIEETRQRISNRDWSLEYDDDTIFSQSPSALYYWAPIADELKQRDELIVRNSIRFRWIEVRRSTRDLLNIELILQNEINPEAV